MPAGYIDRTIDVADDNSVTLAPTQPFDADVMINFEYMSAPQHSAEWYVIAPPDTTWLGLPQTPSILERFGASIGELHLLRVDAWTGGWNAYRATVAREIADVLHGKAGRAHGLFTY